MDAIDVDPKDHFVPLFKFKLAGAEVDKLIASDQASTLGMINVYCQALSSVNERNSQKLASRIVFCMSVFSPHSHTDESC